jgi:hypothetical protein
VAAIRTTSLPGLTRTGSAAAAAFKVELSDGLATTVHLAAYDLSRTAVRVVALPRAEPLAAWCRRAAVTDAIVGGFFVRETGRPLGELRLGGLAHESVPFARPWDTLRSCVHIDGGSMRLARRPDLPPRPRGDLLQAGPLLVEGGSPVATDGADSEGFSAARDQFDSDITAGRHPRAALGLATGICLALVCDGRATADAGLTLAELAQLMAALGAHEAINLDGGGSATLVCGGRLANRPREQDGDDIPGGRPVSTAIAFAPLNRRPATPNGAGVLAHA